MIAKIVCISFLILGVFITNNYPGVQATYGDSNSEVNSKNTANAVNRDTTDVRVNNGKGPNNPYGGCGYNNFFCYWK